MSQAAALESGAQQEVELPALREELDLFPGQEALDGTPTWVLQDPVGHRFFQIGKREFAILIHWHRGTMQGVLAALQAEGKHDYSLEEIGEMAEFLVQHNLIQARGPQALARLQEQYDKLMRRDLWWLIKNYLFISIPLVNPDKFLKKTLPYLSWIGTRRFLWFTVGVALFGLYLAQRQWEGFLSTFPYFFSFTGAIALVVSLSLVKVLHELGHAYTARHYGCHVPSMGVALLVLWPVLYTDASDTWRLRSRRQRLMVSAAGILTELGLAAYATLLWSFLDEGLLKSVVFMLATSTWILTLLVNLNPFMRFDGYYLFTDLVGVPNLQSRAFALARWQLREWLFGLWAPEPEVFPPRTQRILLFYAFGTWIYRFFLFLGIALAVYHLFFKVLGIVMMMIEIVWFLALPLFREFKAWHEMRRDMRWNFAVFRTFFLLGLVFALLLFPFRWDVAAPGILRAENYAQIYAEVGGRVAAVDVEVGQRVSSGELLLEIDSPDLEYQIRQGQQRIDMLNRQIQGQDFNRELQERALVLRQELQAELTAQQGRLYEQDAQQVRSPLDGVVRELRSLRPGEWLGRGEELAVITDPDAALVQAWVAETELHRLTEGDRGWFYPEDIHRSPVAVTLTQIDSTSTGELDELLLASTAGGQLAVREDRDGALIPVQPVYRVAARPDEMLVPEQTLRGTLKLDGQRESIAGRLWRTMVTVFIRESGF